MSEVKAAAPASEQQPRPRRPKRQFFKKKRCCPFSTPGAPKVDYKDLRLLQKFVSDSGKILPSRITSVSTKYQRHLTVAVKRARFLALLPFQSRD
jgi:small subunit ribosomal protein S18